MLSVLEESLLKEIAELTLKIQNQHLYIVSLSIAYIEFGL